MKITTPALVLMLVLSGCSKDHPSASQAVSPKWAEPKNPDIEFYIATPIQRVTLKPSEGSWDSNARAVSRFSTDQESEFPYTVEVEYQGTESGSDHYLVKVTYPLPPATETVEKKILFQGAEIELWRDENCQIGVRQRTPLPES